MIPPGLEPGTFRVLGERDNHYTTESYYTSLNWYYLERCRATIDLVKFGLAMRSMFLCFHSDFD